MITLLLTALTTVIVGTTAQNLTFTAIPEQLETTLIARADAVTNLIENYISEKCNVDVNVVYNPVTNYQDAVDALLDNSADFGWYGGLTGVQAGLRSSPAVYLTQRIEDTQVSTYLMHHFTFCLSLLFVCLILIFDTISMKFTSVFISDGKDLTSIDDVQDKTLAFGSASSTSGHLMPHTI